MSKNYLVMTLAVVLSSTIILSSQTTAESTELAGRAVSETPPIPPYTIYGIIYDKTGMPVSDATVTITNLRTDELLEAEFYENGAYEGILEDLPSGYAVNDEIEIEVITSAQTINKIIVVKQMGFGERVDIHFGDGKNDAESANVLAATSKVQSNQIKANMIQDYDSQSSLNTWPESNAENSDPIIIDSITTNSVSEPVAKITLVDMSAPPYERLAFTDKENDLRFSLRNDGDERVIVIVDLYHVEPDGVTESFLKTVHFGMLFPGREKFRNVFEDEEGWIPTERGRNWIRGEIYVKEKGHERIFVNEFKESFNVVPGWRPVLELGTTIITEPTTWENLTVVIDGDLIVYAPLNYVNTDVIGDDLIVSAAPVTIDGGSSHDMAASNDGQYKVEVTAPDGILNIYGKLWNNDYKYHYWFYMNGTLNMGVDPDVPGADPGIVENTHGNTSDLSQPGGI